MQLIAGGGVRTWADVARTVPEDRMLIETDSPFLAPIPYRGKRNEPAFVAKTAEKIAELRGKSAEEIGDITAQNFFRFFRLASRLARK